MIDLSGRTASFHQLICKITKFLFNELIWYHKIFLHDTNSEGIFIGWSVGKILGI